MTGGCRTYGWKYGRGLNICRRYKYIEYLRRPNICRKYIEYIRRLNICRKSQFQSAADWDPRMGRRGRPLASGLQLKITRNQQNELNLSMSIYSNMRWPVICSIESAEDTAIKRKHCKKSDNGRSVQNSCCLCCCTITTYRKLVHT